MLRSRTFVATPPGETIREQLEDRGMSMAEFSARMGLPKKQVDRLIHGAVRLTPEIASVLESVLGIPMQFWVNLEANYRGKRKNVWEENNPDGPGRYNAITVI